MRRLLIVVLAAAARARELGEAPPGTAPPEDGWGRYAVSGGARLYTCGGKWARPARAHMHTPLAQAIVGLLLMAAMFSGLHWTGSKTPDWRIT